MKRTCRHLLSLVLAAVMVLGVIAPGLGVLRAYAASPKAANVTCGDLTFVVPEVIYLAPTTATSSTFQYYVNNTSAGEVVASYESKGMIYYRYANASSVSLSYSFYNADLSNSLSGGSVTLGTPSVSDGLTTVEITGGSSPTNGGSSYIQWALSYHDGNDNKNKTAYAYTYVYDNGISTNKTVVADQVFQLLTGFWKSNREILNWSIWISGVNGIQSYAGNRADKYLDCRYAYPPLTTSSINLKSGSSTDPSNSDTIDGCYVEATGCMGYTGYWWKDDGGEERSQTSYYKAIVNVDTSRITSTSQIPNLKVGLDVFENWGGDGDGTNTWGLGYYASGSTENQTNLIAQTTSSGSNGSRFSGRSTANIKTLSINVSALTSTKTYILQSRGTSRNAGYEIDTKSHIYFDLVPVDKSSLRTAVNNATKAMAKLGVNGASNGSLTSCYFDADDNYKWTAFQTAYKNAVRALTNPSATDTSAASELNNALAALCTKVTYNANGGTLSGTADDYVTIGTNQSASYTPLTGNTATRPGYTFLGWSLNANATSGSTSVTVGYNNTLYAVWTPINYTVTFDGNGATGGSTADQTFTYGTAQNLNANGFTKSSYQVTYNLNNGTMTATNPVTVQDTFAGWKGSPRLISDLGTEYSKDYTSGSSGSYQEIKQWTIAAPFAANEVFHLEFDAKGSGQLTNYFYGAGGYWQIASGVNNAGHTYTGSDGNVEHALTNNYKHYTVTWTLKSSGNANVEKYVLFRVFGGNSATVKNIVFWKETGAATYSDQQQNVNNLCTTAGAVYQMRAQWTPGSVTLPNPTRDGYTFGGWYSDEALQTSVGAAGVSYTPTADTTLYAKWTAINYSISYTLNGGTVSPANPTSYTADSAAITLNNPTKTGYTFAGWTGSNGTTPSTNVTIPHGSTGAKSYTANWTANGFTVSFDGNGATGGSMNPQSFTYGTSQALTANAFSRAYTVTYRYNDGVTADTTSTATATFNGWATSASGSVVYTNGQSVSNLTAANGGNVTIFANWTLGSVTLPNPTRDGYTFGGWYSDETLQTSVGAAGVSYTPTADTTLYAKWTAINYTLTYELASGSTLPTGASLPATVHNKHIGDTVMLTQPAPVTGYTFDGWKLNGTTVTSVTFGAGNITVTGSWTANQYTITFDSAGGSAVASITQAYGSAITAPQDPTRAGYVFAGWQPQLPSTMPLGGLTVVAQWTKVAVDDQYVLDYGLPVDLAVLSNDIPDASLKSVTASGSGYNAAKSGSVIRFTPTAALNAPVTFTYTVTYSGTDYTASVTVIPANNVYYEESFISFENGGGVTWTAAGSAFANAFQEGARPGDEASPVYGFDSTYDNKNATTYSLGTAMYAEVNATNKGGATATFTFTGTGFDFYSVTNNQSGLAFVDVYKQNANVEGGWENIESTMVNTYFGYKYGLLYLDANDNVTLTETSTPIYYAPAGQTADTFFIEGTIRGWRTPTYYDTNGTIVTGTTSDQSKVAYARGWVAGESSGVSGVYQVPVISRTGLTYGTYKVVVEPRWSARQNMTGGTSYKFYVDAVRVYDPIDPSTITGGTTVYNAYAAENELNATYKSVREQLKSSFGETGGNGTAGVVLLETGDTTCTPAEYQNIGPKNEVYLNPGQAIAFHLTTSSATAPAKVSVGLKMASGETGTVKVYGNGEKTLIVNGATELYQDISSVMAENWTDANGVKTTSSPIIIRNTGSGVVSITNLKWSYAASVPAAGRMLSFSFAPQDLTTASAVLRQATPTPETVTPDTPAAQQLPQFDNGRRMLTLQSLLEMIFGRFFEALRTAFFKK